MGYFIRGACVGLVLIGVSISQAEVISVAPGATPLAPPDDIIIIGGGPAVTGTGAFNVDAFTYGFTAPISPSRALFSVDPGSLGAPGSAVSFQAMLGGGEGTSADLYSWSAAAPGTNALYADGDDSVPGVLPGTGFAETTNIDAVDGRTFGTRAFWSLDAATVGLAVGGAMSGADILDDLLPSAFYPDSGPYATFSALGLMMADDIDALEVVDVGSLGFTDPGDFVFFSLAPGSPSLGILGGTAGDVFAVAPAVMPAPFLFLDHSTALGLAAGDNLNALSFSAVPEPSAFVLLFMAALCLIGFHRQAQKQAA